MNLQLLIQYIFFVTYGASFNSNRLSLSRLLSPNQKLLPQHSRFETLLFANSNTDEKNILDVVVIGAGISGLTCAKELQSNSKQSSSSVTPRILVLEKGSSAGGRVQTDTCQGFLLDRGFQIFIDSYPLVQTPRIIDKEALQLNQFAPGALVRFNDRFHRVSDPFRRPTELFESLVTPIGSIVDKVLVGILSIFSRFDSFENIEREDEMTTEQYLKSKLGLSDSMIKRFFTPFFQGIFLARLEEQSSRMFRFVFKVLADGAGCLPEKGMGVVTAQVASDLRPNTLRLNTQVTKILKSSDNSQLYTVRTMDTKTGEVAQYSASSVVVATDAPTARSLLGDLQQSAPELSLSLSLSALESVRSRSSTCLYYNLPGLPPVTDSVLMLNGDTGNEVDERSSVPVVNNVCFPSQISKSYAPAGRSLASVTVVGVADNIAEADLDRSVRAQLTKWWPDAGIESTWSLLRVYKYELIHIFLSPIHIVIIVLLIISHRIKYAQPAQLTPYAYGQTPVRLAPGLYQCGDHVGTATLNGAIDSGIRAAEAIRAS